MADIFVCVMDGLMGLARGDVLAADDQRAVSRPDAFTRWAPPPVSTAAGIVVAKPFVVLDSFANSDRLVLRGEVLEHRDPLRRFGQLVRPWSPPAVRPSQEMS